MNGALPYNLDSADRTTAAVDDVVSAAQAGSPEAFRKLHVLYSRRLYRTIVAIMKNPQDAEDALQDTFLRAYLAIHKFEGRSNIYTWLTRIAINSAIMILRKQRTECAKLSCAGANQPPCYIIVVLRTLQRLIARDMAAIPTARL